MRSKLTGKPRERLTVGISYSKSTMETPKQCVQICSKLTVKTP